MSDTADVIQVEQLSKRFTIRKDKSIKERLVNATASRRHREDFWALRDVSLSIPSGSTIGLIGPNGSGKSTLLKAIGGIIQPTSGTVRRRGRLAALLELGAGFHPDLSGRENVYLNAAILGLSTKQTDQYFESIVDFSGIEKFIDSQVKFYSSGMYVRLAFAVAVHVDPDILLVDEVLAVGDEPFQRKCMDRIKQFQQEGRTIVLVTHALDQVADICDRAVVLENGQVVVDGTARDAIRTLRADFDAQTASDRVDQNPAGAKVLSIQPTGPDGRPVQQLVPGEDLLLRVTVEADKPLDDWIVGVGIDTPTGQQVFGTNTQLLGVRMDRLVGRRTIDIRLAGLALGEGDYHVHGALAHWNGPAFTKLSEGASLSVEGPRRSIGPVGVRDISATAHDEQLVPDAG
ncbi:ABC transporter ATP-binding protein [Candidatus Blastococcus massiliensis]|uniref:ABC transporter ATP-binding protein n=1 Tax=Candidatus Blastococcus massiliensis TaxID=1470358 RepID=UPI0004B5499B|nr:ABC transporter ATP-binding protein [Candidatus Blastococcus massiliensis]